MVCPNLTGAAAQRVINQSLHVRRLMTDGYYSAKALAERRAAKDVEEAEIDRLLRFAAVHDCTAVVALRTGRFELERSRAMEKKLGQREKHGRGAQDLLLPEEMAAVVRSYRISKHFPHVGEHAAASSSRRWS